jgi:tellurite resistance protein
LSLHLSPPQALIYAMITVAAVDRKISDIELARIGSIVRDLPAFEGFEDERLVEESQSCGRLLARANGLEHVLDLIYSALPEHMRETAYALAAEIAAADRKVDPAEVKFLQMLGQRLEVDRLTCAALDHAARARHQRP